MRRGATLFVAVGLTVAGIGFASVPRPGVRADRRTGIRLAAMSAGSGPAGTMGTKVVRFGGYSIDVPGAWPVYHLGPGSTRCVRYDKHAVYLGPPGTDQQCPAHLVGRVATVSLQASGPAAAVTPPGTWRRPPARMGLDRVAGHGSVVMQDQQDGELRAILTGPGLTISATYGGDPAVVARIIRSARRTGPAGQQTAPSKPARSTAVPSSTTAAGRAAPAHAVTPAAARRRQQAAPGMLGFDTCTAPPVAVMSRWRSRYGAAAIYLGGPDAACGDGNLSAAWVRSVLRQGWSLIPTYVGPQAPCTTFPNRIKVGHARAMGRAAADDAIALASGLGLRRGAPVYGDMEWYDHSNGVCRRQVLSFLNAWTRELHARGYLSGVYSSASAAVTDLTRTSRVYGQRLARPDGIWFGLWDGQDNLQGGSYLGNWWDGRRIKQYQGGHRQTVDGATLWIDSDQVDGPVYR